jgi:hypothetical protein
MTHGAEREWKADKEALVTRADRDLHDNFLGKTRHRKKPPPPGFRQDGWAKAVGKRSADTARSGRMVLDTFRYKVRISKEPSREDTTGYIEGNVINIDPILVS